MWDGGPASASDRVKARFADTRQCWLVIASASGLPARLRNYSKPFWMTAGKAKPGFRTVNNPSNSASVRSCSAAPTTSTHAKRGWAMKDRDRLDVIVVGEGLAG